MYLSCCSIYSSSRRMPLSFKRISSACCVWLLSLRSMSDSQMSFLTSVLQPSQTKYILFSSYWMRLFQRLAFSNCWALAVNCVFRPWIQSSCRFCQFKSLLFSQLVLSQLLLNFYRNSSTSTAFSRILNPNCCQKRVSCSPSLRHNCVRVAELRPCSIFPNCRLQLVSYYYSYYTLLSKRALPFRGWTSVRSCQESSSSGLTKVLLGNGRSKKSTDFEYAKVFSLSFSFTVFSFEESYFMVFLAI